jgi:NDP-sugar pyrophosphorylase family protein
MSAYQVIITLGGTGKRFADAGYELPKYMLPISIFDSNYKVIDLVTEMYKDSDTDILFLCNKDHVEKYHLKQLLGKYGTVIPVVPGKGPGDAILQAKNFIDDNKQTFVQYCDTFQPWDLQKIKNYIEKYNPDSAVVVTNEKCPSVYDGTLYGRVIVKDNLIKDIKEKAEPEYSDYLGCGTFYFKSGSILLKYIEIQDKDKDKYYLNGESYINCTIKAMLDDCQIVIPINVIGYLNLGVPRDYEEYMYWQRLECKYENKIIHKRALLPNSTIIIPAAGLGSRFKDVYNKPKPLIDVNNSPMYKEAINLSFNPENVVIVTRKDLDFYKEFKDSAENSGYTFIGLDSITDGQAITIKEGLKEITHGPIIINSCDQGILYDEIKFNNIYDSSDIIVCGIKNYQPALRKVNSFSWIKCDGDNVIEVASKRCDGDPKESLAFVSCLLYKDKHILEDSINALIKRGAKTNGEYYIDESINDSISLGYKVKVLEIDAYLNWGTPEELELYQWWNRFFTKIGLYDYLA